MISTRTNKWLVKYGQAPLRCVHISVVLHLNTNAHTTRINTLPVLYKPTNMCNQLNKVRQAWHMQKHEMQASLLKRKKRNILQREQQKLLPLEPRCYTKTGARLYIIDK